MSDDRGTIAGAAAALRWGTVSAVELAEAALAKIDANDERIGAYLALSSEIARAAALEADRRFREDPDGAGPLCGIPVAIKDVLCLEGVETTAGSRILQGFIPPLHGHGCAATCGRRGGRRREDEL